MPIRRPSAAPLSPVLLLALAAAGCGGGVDRTGEGVGVAASALESTTLLVAESDTTITKGLRTASPGGGASLWLGSHDRRRALVGFDPDALAAAAGAAVLLRADLVTDIDAGVSGRERGPRGGRCAWGDPRGAAEVTLHRLRQEFTEEGATWYCADDPGPRPRSAECAREDRWNMDGRGVPLAYDRAPTATAELAPAGTTTVEFDVTADVASFLDGSTPTASWLLRSDAPGSFAIASSESGGGVALRLTFDDGGGGGGSGGGGGGGGGEPCLPTGAGEAQCDGRDDDCDGEIDEDFVPTPYTCGVGACAATGAVACLPGGQLTVDCTPGAPDPAGDTDCDGVDDDCDGLADEGFPAAVTTCGAGACASSGISQCIAGVAVDSCVPLCGG